MELFKFCARAMKNRQRFAGEVVLLLETILLAN